MWRQNAEGPKKKKGEIISSPSLLALCVLEKSPFRKFNFGAI